MEENIRKLNFLLSNLQVQRANLQAAHWNLRGCHSFITFHNYYGELYDLNTGHIDIIAEFIRIYNGDPFITFSRYVRRATIEEVTQEQTQEVEATLRKAITDNSLVMTQIEELFKSTAEGPADVNDYMAAMTADYGKRQWFLNSSTSKKEEAPVEKVDEEAEITED